MAWLVATQKTLMPTAAARERNLFTRSSYGSLHTFFAPTSLNAASSFVRHDARNSRLAKLSQIF
jgi:hypothetical protein